MGDLHLGDHIETGWMLPASAFHYVMKWAWMDRAACLAILKIQ